MKVQAGSFHLNAHIIGFRPQTQKLQSPFKTPSSTLAVKGLKGTLICMHFVNNCFLSTISAEEKLMFCVSLQTKKELALQ